MSFKNLTAAKIEKNDEFYTKYEDIEKEIFNHEEYTDILIGKTVYLPCDNPEKSSFYKFFKNNFQKLKIKKLICTFLGNDTYKTVYTGRKELKIPLDENGDFRNEECVEILKDSDIIITNPPFSLFRDFLKLLINYNKTFLIIGNINAATCKEVCPLFKENKVWFGYSSIKEFIEPSGALKHFGNIFWYTNIDLKKRHTELKLEHIYKGNEDLYPEYDSFNAINIDRIKNIPKDYTGIMGVPITFLLKYCPEQFRIIGIDRYEAPSEALYKWRLTVKGKSKYARILICRN